MEKVSKKLTIQSFANFTATRKLESYTGKERKPYEYMRTAGADECKPVLHLEGLIKNGNAKYKKH